MFFLIVPLCVFAVARSESLISLRDYDFIGEDKRLMSLLAERMAFSREGFDLTGAGVHVSPNLTKDQTHFNESEDPLDLLKSDQMQLKFKTYSVNVSMDYGKLYKTSGEFKPETNTPWPWLGLPQNVPALNFTSPLGFRENRRDGNLTGNPTGNLTASRRLNEGDFYYDPTYYWYNMKILNIMRHNIYTAQKRLTEIHPLVQKYESSEVFRIAYIFTKIDTWLQELRNLMFAMKQEPYTEEFPYPTRFKKYLLYYQHALRKNVDITYTIDFLIHLHIQYMKKVEQLVPKAQRLLWKNQETKKETPKRF